MTRFEAGAAVAALIVALAAAYVLLVGPPVAQPPQDEAPKVSTQKKP